MYEPLFTVSTYEGFPSLVLVRVFGDGTHPLFRPPHRRFHHAAERQASSQSVALNGHALNLFRGPRNESGGAELFLELCSSPHRWKLTILTILKICPK